VYYASKDNFYHPWTEPIELAQAIVYEADTPAIIKHQDELIVIYHNDFPTTRWMRRSFNGGQTWTEPAPAFPGYVGSNGAVSFARDSSNRLHVFFGNRNADATVNGMWHSLWQGGNWSNPQPVVSRITARRDQKDQGEVQDQGYMDGARRDPSFANAVVSQGNTILLTWTTDPGSDRNGVWYSYVTLDAPELPIVARPTPTSTSTPTPVPVAETPTSTPTDTPMPRQVNQFDEVPVDSPNSSATVLTLSLIPVTLLILGVVLFYVRRT
jgi:hypothetical protein